MSFQERPYQTEAHDAHVNYWASGGGNPLIVLPTGAGKSYQMAKFLKWSIDEFPGTRPLVLASFPELLVQNYKEIISLWPQAPAGLYSASLGKRQSNAQILFAGIQSIHRKAFMLPNFDYVLVDEAHMISRKGGTMYRRFFDDLLSINPTMRIAGYTATEFRTDSGMLHEGPDALFDGIAYKAEIKDLMDAGYLAPLTSRQTGVDIDTTGIATSAGDFNREQLDARACDPDTVNAIADCVKANSEGRYGILVFGSGKKSTIALMNALYERGLYGEYAFDDTPRDQRNRSVENFKAGRLRVLGCYGLFTTGFNARHVDLIVMARATKSRGLYIQIAGRGTRTWDGNRVIPPKRDCLCLDFGGNIARHGPIDNMKPIKAKRGSGGEAPYKICKNCGEENHATARHCVKCGYEFPPPESKVAKEASTLDIMSSGAETRTNEWIGVDSVYYTLHTPRDENKPVSLKVSYRCGLLFYNEWICLEHEGAAKYKAIAWWRRRAPGGTAVPQTISEALEVANCLDKPKQIAIRQNGKFTEVVGHRYFERDVVSTAA
jgi:DNA repair protein RadD